MDEGWGVLGPTPPWWGVLGPTTPLLSPSETPHEESHVGIS